MDYKETIIFRWCVKSLNYVIWETKQINNIPIGQDKIKSHQGRLEE